jgi:hypothetical protein
VHGRRIDSLHASVCRATGPAKAISPATENLVEDMSSLPSSPTQRALTLIRW